MSLPNIKVGDTVRITSIRRCADFVKKGDVAKVVEVGEHAYSFGLWLESSTWNWKQYITVYKTKVEFERNSALTFLHKSQKLVDKPEE